jgi:hypothetical protein
MSRGLRTLLLGAIALSTSACYYSYDGRRLANNHYCDSFMIYDMCAVDPNRDGRVDFVYFEDTDEVFMFSEGGLARKPASRPMHRCAQQMEEDLVEITSRLFYVDEDTSALEKNDIRGAMMIRYFAKLPEVTACNLRAEQAEKAAQEDGTRETEG